MNEDNTCMGKLKERMMSFETAMTAASFAEEGEAGIARNIINDERRILLAVTREQMDKKTFRYAVNTCKRIGADLDVLYISESDAPDPLLDECLAELKAEGINYRLMHKNGSLKQSIIDYTNKKKKILFAVIGDKGISRGMSQAWHNLKCPLVVVEDAA